MLLLCLFVYDIFWVFFSERLKIMFPRNLLCGVSASDFMMLGLGDMPIGLVSALAAGFLTHSPQPALLYLWGASQCVMQWGASMYYAVGSRQTHYIMVLHVFAQPSEERHTVTVQRFRRTSQIRRWRSYPPKPQRCARTHHDRRWSSKCYSRGQNGVHDVVRQPPIAFQSFMY
ncbi:hypothetical protein IGI04_031329 [Brassica rapa subsp. trilocularis]|uniref:Nodulin-like domain-containing protein n=1 Tax=Brassica rapa subsp. trilocularis TaxID=1813537 RepID=A0ABQ7LVT8_BRACM|nr:hypothetical protein IGI04_031329 [Brassica rapa subsp. trilocularis]